MDDKVVVDALSDGFGGKWDGFEIGQCLKRFRTWPTYLG